jgi:hypothetical protein
MEEQLKLKVIKNVFGKIYLIEGEEKVRDYLFNIK